LLEKSAHGKEEEIEATEGKAIALAAAYFNSNEVLERFGHFAPLDMHMPCTCAQDTAVPVSSLATKGYTATLIIWPQTNTDDNNQDKRMYRRA
jgi:hypothetical protein